MKKSSQIWNYVIAIATLIVMSCDVQNVLNEEEGNENPLIVVDLNFLNSKINVTLVDPETQLPMNENMTVRVYANKRIVNLKGKYKNRFQVGDGTLTFSVDPNENITATEPLQLKIVASNNRYLSADARYEITSEGDHFIYLSIYREQEVEDLVDNALANLPFRAASDYDIYANDENIQNSVLPLISMEGSIQVLDYEKEKYNAEAMSLSNFLPLLDRQAVLSTSSVYYGFNKLVPSAPQNDALDLDTAISYKENAAVLTSESKLFVSYTTSNEGQTEDVTLVLGQQNEIFEYREVTTTQYDYSFTETDLGNGSEVIIPQGAKVNYIGIGKASLGYNICSVGSTVNILMPEGADGATVSYTLTNNNFLKVSETVSVNSGSNTFNTGSFAFEEDQPNVVTIEDTDQYDFEPNSIALNGCPQTYNFTATPQSNLSKYNISAQFSCIGQQIAVTPTILAQIKRKDAPESEWEYFTFESGNVSLYLIPEEEYVVKGDFDEEEYYFEFTTTFDESVIQQLISDTIAENSGIDSVEYDYNTISSSETDINITVILKENACTFTN